MNAMDQASEGKLAVEGASPSPGWLAVVPIPGAAQGAERTGVFSATPGLIAAIVVEKNTAPGAETFPYEAGDTVYFAEGIGVEIGDRLFIQINAPIAYKKEENGS